MLCCSQSCLFLCNPLSCSLPSSSAHGIFQTNILEWVDISSSRDSPLPRGQTHISSVFCTAGGFFNHWAIREAQLFLIGGTLFTEWQREKNVKKITFFFFYTGAGCRVLFQGISWPRDQAHVCRVPCIDRRKRKVEIVDYDKIHTQWKNGSHVLTSIIFVNMTYIRKIVLKVASDT